MAVKRRAGTRKEIEVLAAIYFANWIANTVLWWLYHTPEVWYAPDYWNVHGWERHAEIAARAFDGALTHATNKERFMRTGHCGCRKPTCPCRRHREGWKDMRCP